jgi:hypothetical protein
MRFDAEAALGRAIALLREASDVLEERVASADVPAWCARRGWEGALLGMSDEELRACEAEGLAVRAEAMAGLPASLVELAREVREVTELPPLASAPWSGDEGRSVRARKAPQLARLLGAVDAMARHAHRIVDVGSGSGHFTRLAAGVFEREALGMERDPARVAAAEARVASVRSAGEAPEGGAGRGEQARFVEIDLGRDVLALAEGDLAVGLHACGALGDRLIEAAARAGCDAALVSCCLQKIPGEERAPLSRAAAGLLLRRETLGLSNLTSQAQGVETSIEATMAAREARHALNALLRSRGVDLPLGEEMRRINRRRAHHGLAAIAGPALALRGLAPASEEELHAHEAAARRDFGVVRRLSLPRNMLARVVEMAVVLDRAAALAESGHHVRVATVFDRAVTPRNIGLFASRDPARLPA